MIFPLRPSNGGSSQVTMIAVELMTLADALLGAAVGTVYNNTTTC